jgi:hypothetical protein
MTMASTRFTAMLHEGETSQPIEVSADPQTLILHTPGKARRWPFAELRYHPGGVPRFEHQQSLLIVADPQIVQSIEMLNPAAVSQMEKAAGGHFTGRDFLSGLLAVLIVMGGALLLFAAIWFIRTRT